MKFFWSIIRLSGGAIVLYSILGFIAGLFDYVLVLKGSELPLIDGAIAIVLVVVGAALFALGHFMLKRAERKEPEGQHIPQLDVNNLGFIESAIKRTRRRNFIFGFLLVIVGGFMGMIPFLDPEASPTSGGSIFIYVLVSLMVVMGIWMLEKAMKLLNIQDSDVYKTIMLEPKTITGLSAQIIRNQYTKHGTQINATLKVQDKKLAILSVSENELELLRQYLTKHNPQLMCDVREQVA